MGWGAEGIAEAALEAATSSGWTVQLLSAGFARTVTTYDLPDLAKGDPDASSSCIPVPPNADPESGPRACVQEVGRRGASRIACPVPVIGVCLLHVDSGVPAVACPPGICAATGPGFAAGAGLAYEQVVTCTVEDGCDGKPVRTAAAVLQPLPGDEASAEALCGGVSQVGSLAGFGDSIDRDGPALKPMGQDYECRMGFQAVAGSTPYLGVSACYDAV